MFDLFSKTLVNSSTDTLLESKYCRSLLRTRSSSSYVTSSSDSLASTVAATSAIVLETSETFALRESPALSSLLLHFVGMTRSISLIARPCERTTSQTAFRVSFIIS